MPVSFLRTLLLRLRLCAVCKAVDEMLPILEPDAVSVPLLDPNMLCPEIVFWWLYDVRG